MFFRCPNIQAHYNEAVICLNVGTPENNEFSIWDIIILGVPILKHIGVSRGFVFQSISTVGNHVI